MTRITINNLAKKKNKYYEINRKSIKTNYW